MLHFYNTFLNLFNISCIFSSGIIISSTFVGFSLGLTILSSFDLVTNSLILFPKNPPALWTNFLEVIFKKSSPVSSNCFLYFLANI